MIMQSSLALGFLSLWRLRLGDVSSSRVQLVIGQDRNLCLLQWHFTHAIDSSVCSHLQESFKKEKADLLRQNGELQKNLVRTTATLQQHSH